MLRTFVLIAGLTVGAVVVAQDRNTMQSCLAYEAAALIQSAPKGLTDEQAFSRGRELANKIPESLFEAIKRLPDLQETGHAMVEAAQQSAISFSRQLTPQAVQREVDRCRVIFPPRIEKVIQQEGSFPPLRSYSELASRVNESLLNDGMVGVLNLLNSCHGQGSVNGRDCVALDAAGRFVFDGGAREFGADKIPRLVHEYFEESAQKRRIVALASARRGTYEALTAYYEDARVALPKLLLADLKTQIESSKKSNCLVQDSDIADSYVGDCRNGLANGVGTARGRDEYTGGFLDGVLHGHGVYRRGDSSKWRSEMYEGGYYRGDRYGFGVWSVDINSNHPALESISRSKTAALVGTRYYIAGLWARTRLIRKCRNIAECLDSTSVLGTNLSSTSQLLTPGSSRLQVADIRAALFSDLQALGQTRRGAEACFAGEILSLARVNQPEAAYLNREQLEAIVKLISDRNILVKLLIYCTDARS